MCAFGEDLRIVEWNEAAERLTGMPAADAIGRPCWAVLHGRDDAGSIVCHRGCSGARLARSGWPLSPQLLTIRTRGGASRVAVDTVTSLRRPFLMVHLMRPVDAAADGATVDGLQLTPRQAQVLRLLAQGRSATAIAAELGIAKSTVRSHIRGVLAELGAHSQLEAVAEARARRLV